MNVFIDSTGRAYSLPAHTLPSARGQGEPLSGRLDPPEGATFAAVAIGEPADKWLLACDAGHGFIARLEALTGRNRAGKTVFRLPENAKVLPAAPVPAEDGALVVSVNSDGRMLAFPVADLPEMEKGRGNLIFGIPGKRSRSGEELMVAAVVAKSGQTVTVHCGDRTMALSWKDLQDFVGAVLPEWHLAFADLRDPRRVEIVNDGPEAGVGADQRERDSMVIEEIHQPSVRITPSQSERRGSLGAGIM